MSFAFELVCVHAHARTHAHARAYEEIFERVITKRHTDKYKASRHTHTPHRYNHTHHPPPTHAPQMHTHLTLVRKKMIREIARILLRIQLFVSSHVPAQLSNVSRHLNVAHARQDFFLKFYF